MLAKQMSLLLTPLALGSLSEYHVSATRRIALDSESYAPFRASQAQRSSPLHSIQNCGHRLTPYPSSRERFEGGQLRRCHFTEREFHVTRTHVL